MLNSKSLKFFWDTATFPLLIFPWVGKVNADTSFAGDVPVKSFADSTGPMVEVLV